MAEYQPSVEGIFTISSRFSGVFLRLFSWLSIVYPRISTCSNVVSPCSFARFSADFPTTVIVFFGLQFHIRTFSSNIKAFCRTFRSISHCSAKMSLKNALDCCDIPCVFRRVCNTVSAVFHIDSNRISGRYPANIHYSAHDFRRSFPCLVLDIVSFLWYCVRCQRRWHTWAGP